LDPTGLGKPSKTSGLTGTGPGLAHQDVAGLVFERVWNRNEPFYGSQPGPLAGYPDPFLTLSARSREETGSRTELEASGNMSNGYSEPLQGIGSTAVRTKSTHKS